VCGFPRRTQTRCVVCSLHPRLRKLHWCRTHRVTSLTIVNFEEPPPGSSFLAWVWPRCGRLGGTRRSRWPCDNEEGPTNGPSLPTEGPRTPPDNRSFARPCLLFLGQTAPDFALRLSVSRATDGLLIINVWNLSDCVRVLPCSYSQGPTI
jgi:hypothetical protein